MNDFLSLWVRGVMDLILFFFSFRMDVLNIGVPMNVRLKAKVKRGMKVKLKTLIKNRALKHRMGLKKKKR